MGAPESRTQRAGLLALLAAAALGLSAVPAHAQDPPPRGAPAAVRPGAPGSPSRPLAPEDLGAPTQAHHTNADVTFMQNMIVHHRQALVMSALVPERTAREDVRRLAHRIELSQDAEIALMRRWLELRGQEAPDPGAHHGHHAGHGAPAEAGAPMAGMLTDAELAALAAAEGPAFDRLFLEFMIRHHEGALDMVGTLFSSPGAARDSDIFGFASEVDSDQRMEIVRMRTMLGGTP